VDSVKQPDPPRQGRRKFKATDTHRSRTYFRARWHVLPLMPAMSVALSGTPTARSKHAAAVCGTCRAVQLCGVLFKVHWLAYSNGPTSTPRSSRCGLLNHASWPCSGPWPLPSRRWAGASTPKRKRRWPSRERGQPFGFGGGEGGFVWEEPKPLDHSSSHALPPRHPNLRPVVCCRPEPWEAR